MHISWHGQYTLVIKSDQATLVLDPYSPAVGLSPLRIKADIVGLSNPDDPTMSHVDSITSTQEAEGDVMIIDRPGEYSVAGFSLKALGWHSETNEQRTVQRWTVEDLVFLYVGALTRSLREDELAELEQTDIDLLLLPIGGGNGLSTKDALSLMTLLEPRIVIPIHYRIAGLKEELHDVTQFAKEVGAEGQQQEKKFTVKAGRLPQEGMMTVLLEP